MGIRVQCPQGHKLKVKDSLAGRRGVCPYCGAKFMIPALSDASPSEDHEPSDHLAQTISVESEKVEPVDDPSISIVTETVRPVGRARGRRSRRSANLVLWLTMIVVILAIVFVWVVLYR